MAREAADHLRCTYASGGYQNGITHRNHAAQAGAGAIPQRRAQVMHKPTREENKIIRSCAARSAGYKRVELCPGTRYNTEKDRGEHMNIALVSDDPDWNDTDLADNAWSWADFTKGVELTDDGRGIFDFYVYGPVGSYHKELQTNVVAYYEGGKLVRVTGVCDGTLWSSK